MTAVSIGEGKYMPDDTFRKIWDNVQEGIQIIGFDWRYLYINDAVARQAHCPKEDLLGHTMMEKFPGIEQTELFKLIGKCMKDRAVYRLENEFTYPDGTKGWFDLNMQPVSEGVLIMSIDVTVRKKAELEIKRLNENLEIAVQERTGQLIEANNELESFTYSVSHDLRAPLRAMSSFAKILVEEYGNNKKLDNDATDMLWRIQRNTGRMGLLIDDLLAFSRLGRKEIVKTDVDMKALAKEVIKDVVKGNVQVDVGDLPLARADHALMHQVMVNLVSNAFKYSAYNKQPLIHINSAIEGGQIVYSVKDNGVGFDMQYADKLFGVFERLHTSKEFEGTGVGLAIVKRIIDKHGGRVWAQSEPGKGAAFYFFLPAE